MKKAIAVMMILAGSLAAAPRVTFGIGFGAPAPVAVVRPVCPGPGYTWFDGYWHAPAVVVAPHFDRGHYFVDHHFEHFRR